MSQERPSFTSKSESSQESEEKLKDFEKKMEFFRHLEPQGELFVGRWDYDVKMDPQAETFYFSHEDKTVHVAPRLVEERQLEEAEQKFVFEHELGHLVQLLETPESYLETFETTKEKAKEINKDYPGMEDFAKKAWGKFFNVFLDIHDNAIVQDRDPDYRKGGKQQESPKDLYQELFPPEMDEGPHSIQFIQALLRKNMTKGEAKVSPEVQEVLNQSVDVFGDKYESFQQFVDQIISNPHNDLETVNFYLEDFIYDTFEQLLKEDIEAGRTNIPESLKSKVDREGGMMDERTAKKIAEEHKEVQKDPSKRLKEKADQDFKEEIKSEGFSEQEAERMLEIKERTKEAVRQLTTLWERFIQISANFEQVRKEGLKTGASISATEVAKQLPILLSDPTEAKIFTREVSELASESVKPQKISLELVVDLSGSMDKAKRNAVQEVNYALGKSLINFYRNSRLDFSLADKDNPISIDLNVIGFGDSISPLIERLSEEEKTQESIDNQSRDLDMALMKAVGEIQKKNLGGTQDALALQEVERYIEKPRFNESLQEGQNVSIVLEITDGETSTAGKSKQIIKELNEKKNVYPRAIQIPGPIYGEEGTEEKKEGPPKVKKPTGTFKQVWENKGQKLEDLSALKETVVKILYNAFQQK